LSSRGFFDYNLSIGDIFVSSFSFDNLMKTYDKSYPSSYIPPGFANSLEQRDRAMLKSRIQVTPKTLSKPGPPGIRASYSHGIIWRDLLFISGQVAYGPDGNVIRGGVAEQTRQALENMKKICEQAGTTMDNVVKCTVFMTDIGEFEEMNRVYKAYFDIPPARTTVEVASLVRTGGARGSSRRDRRNCSDPEDQKQKSVQN
jgi:2-iminobutanoate/2-iminopropanoate deaminase